MCYRMKFEITTYVDYYQDGGINIRDDYNDNCSKFEMIRNDCDMIMMMIKLII